MESLTHIIRLLLLFHLLFLLGLRCRGGVGGGGAAGSDGDSDAAAAAGGDGGELLPPGGDQLGDVLPLDLRQQELDSVIVGFAADCNNNNNNNKTTESKTAITMTRLVESEIEGMVVGTGGEDVLDVAGGGGGFAAE